MNNNILISIILCNYNYGKFIGQAIESVLNQSFPDFQLIVVDDGSTDNSRDIINSITDNRIIKVFQKNKGQAEAFNAGFKKCKGDYIAFLDSDDFWFPRKLEKTIPIFSQGNISVVQHNLTVVDKNSKKLGKSHPGIKPGLKNVLNLYFKQNHTNFFSVTSGIISERKSLDEIFPLDPEWKICADVAITRPLPLFGCVYTCPENYGAYRIHDSNNWMNSDLQSNKWEENQKKYIEYTNQWLRKYGHDNLVYIKRSRSSRSSFFRKLKNAFFNLTEY